LRLVTDTDLVCKGWVTDGESDVAIAELRVCVLTGRAEPGSAL